MPKKKSKETIEQIARRKELAERWDVSTTTIKKNFTKRLVPKICNRCRKSYPEVEFYTSQSHCRECNAKYYKAKTKEWRSSLQGRARTLVQQAQQRQEAFVEKYPNAPKKRSKFDITYEWVLSRLHYGFCEETGIPFDFSIPKAHNKPNPFVPSLDRIDSNRGYTKDNVVVVVWIYNRGKGADTRADMLKMCQGFIENYYTNCRKYADKTEEGE